MFRKQKKFPTRNSNLDKHQLGFRKSFSTSDAFVPYLNSVYNSNNDRKTF